MPLGPVQLIVLGFEHPDFHGEIAARLDLVEIGLVSADEAQGLHDFETRAHAGVSNAGG